MLRPYRDVLATPGAFAFSSAGFVARMPISMIGLGIVLLISSQTGSYGLAGAVSGTFALVNAVSAPILARFVDRHGQRRIAVPAIAFHVVGLSTLVVLVEAGGPDWTYFLAALAAAAGFPAIGSMVRARWTHALQGSPGLQTAYSLEAVIDELIFVTGPPLVTLLATRAWSWTGLVVALVLLVVGSTALFSQRTTEPPPHPVEGAHGGAVIRLPGMFTIMLVAVWLGAIFGAMEVTVVAFAEERDAAAAAGLMLALYAGGSMVGGLAYGAITWQASLRRRYLLGAIAMAVSLIPLPFIESFRILGPVAFLAGLAIAPTMIANVALVQQLVPRGRFNEGLAWSFTGLGIGLALGAALAGYLIDHVGTNAGFGLAVAAGAAAVSSCLAGMSRLGRVSVESSGVAAQH